MKSLHSVRYSLLLSLLSVWMVVASGHMLFNFSKLFSEEQGWLILSDDEKRERIFGDYHVLYTFLEKQATEKDKTLIISSDGKPYFVGRYYLYPKKIYWDQQMSADSDTADFAYVVVMQPLNDDQKILYKTLVDTDSFRNISPPDLTDNSISLFKAK